VVVIFYYAALEGEMRNNKTNMVLLVFLAFSMIFLSLSAQENSKKYNDAQLKMLVEKGDQTFASGQFQAALENYRKALAMEPENLVLKEKYNDTLAALKENKESGKFKDYLSKSDLYYQKGDVKYAFLYLIEAFRSYPDGREQVGSRLQKMWKKNQDLITKIMDEKQEELMSIRLDLDAMMAGEKKKKQVPAEEEIVTSEEQTAQDDDLSANELFLRKVKLKAKKVYKNELGFWEALFPQNIVMIYVPEGNFTLGSEANSGQKDELPGHKVFLDGYWIAKYETTFAQFDEFCQASGKKKPDDSGWGREDLPVINISWPDAQSYCAWLSEKTKLTFRLPSEAEWEKAAHSFYPWGQAAPTSSRANFGKKENATMAVGSFPDGASFYGACDMAGNVWEWVGDWYDPEYYQNSPQRNPRGPENGSEKSVRGGSWFDGKDTIRSANRDKENPASRLNLIGFRVLLEAK
jgi:formylglycine-generating enzyme required for sulfatase activity